MKPFYYFLILGLFVRPCPLAADPLYQMDGTVEELSFRIISKIIVVEAAIDGRSGYFILDTGVRRLTLNARLFQGDREATGLYLADLNGVARPAEEVPVRSFRWGGLFRDNFSAHVIELKTQERLLGCPLLGLIGQEVFRDVELEIDYDARRLRLFRLDVLGRRLQPAPPPDHLLPFTLEHHIPTLSVHFGRGERVRLGIDSGASINVMDHAWKRKLEPFALDRRTLLFNAALSAREAEFFTLDQMRIAGELALIHCRMAFCSMDYLRRYQVWVDGLLGVDLFRLGRVALNYRRQELAIWVNDNIFSMKYRRLGEGERNGEGRR